MRIALSPNINSALCLYFSWCLLAIAPSSATEPSSQSQQQQEDASTESNIRHFRSRWSDVYIVPDFLPIEIATAWKSKLKEAWTNTTIASSQEDNKNKNEQEVCSTDKGQSCTDQTTFDKTSTFLFATNNEGTPLSQNNAKTRSLDLISERNATAAAMSQSNLFSYAKWELHPSHDLVKDMESYFSSRETRSKVEKILGMHQDEDDDHHPNVQLAGELSDLFVTLYSTGDFLSPHDDGAAGTWAFVVSLMNSPDTDDSEINGGGDVEGGVWKEEYGGALQFQCETEDPRVDLGNIPWCEKLYPRFNSAVFIQTMVVVDDESGYKVPGPMHQVLPVKYPAELEGFFRFGLTGWYTDVGDLMSENRKRERDKMRARD